MRSIGRGFLFVVITLILLLGTRGNAQSPGVPWRAADSLGRRVEPEQKTGPLRENRAVGIFYFLWLTGAVHPSHWTKGPYDISKILDRLSKEEQQDIEHSTSDLWGPNGISYFWGEPLFGYYIISDPWILRKHIHLLTDAGVDFLVFDTTNAVTYPESYFPLCRMLKTIRAEGEPTPQVTFMINTNANETAEKLWKEIYSTGEYDDLLFKLDGKPLLIGDPAQIKNEEIHKKLTLRTAFWPTKMVNSKMAWQWEAAYPQPYGWSQSEDIPEQVNVSVAQNLRQSQQRKDAVVVDMSSGLARGRSFKTGSGKIEVTGDRTDRGDNFAQQWERAWELDPPNVMITGWNEWIAGRWQRDDRNVFVDQFNREYSRDIEPMRGGHLDNYYLQMIEGIRRYKGTPKIPAAPPQKTIRMEDPFSIWDDVAPELTDHRGETIPRDFYGESALRYKNESGRNDIILTKAVRDQKNFYFYLETADPIQPNSPDGLMILLDTDQNLRTGFIGGEYLIGRKYKEDSPGMGTTSLEQHRGKNSEWRWSAKPTKISYKIEENKIMWIVPYQSLGLKGDKISFNKIAFKFLDNIQDPISQYTIPETESNLKTEEVTPEDLYLTGDIAPESRFFYQLREK